MYYRCITHRRSASHLIADLMAPPLRPPTPILVGQMPAMVSRAHLDEVQAKLAYQQHRAPISFALRMLRP
jgi:hypothetical protein